MVPLPAYFLQQDDTIADDQDFIAAMQVQDVAAAMQDYGLYYAAEHHGGSPVKAICIKSVSDLADRAKGDDFQAYCSHMSAMVGLETLRSYFRR